MDQINNATPNTVSSFQTAQPDQSKTRVRTVLADLLPRIPSDNSLDCSATDNRFDQSRISIIESDTSSEDLDLNDLWVALEKFNKKDIKTIIHSKQVNIHSEEVFTKILSIVIKKKRFDLLTFLCTKLLKNLDVTIKKLPRKVPNLSLAYYAMTENASEKNLSTIKKLVKYLQKRGLKPMSPLDLNDFRKECDEYKILQSDVDLREKVFTILSSEKEPSCFNLFFD